MRSVRNVSTISQLKPEKRSNMLSIRIPRFGLKPEVSADTSSCYFRSNYTTRNVSDHHTFLPLIWQNLPYHRLGWLERNTLFSKDILVNMFSRIPCKMAAVNGDENAVPTNLESSSSESNTKTRKRVNYTLCDIVRATTARSRNYQRKPLVLSKNGGTQ